jgi:1-acyl-sn-glycerol-3-phosphate acyltransferase
VPVRHSHGMAERAEFSGGWRLVTTLCAPVMHRWARMTVRGLEHVPTAGPTLLVANHDSYWDPVAASVALDGHRPAHALAKASLWKLPLVGRLMDSLGNIPVERGSGDSGPVDAAIDALRAGKCIAIFPEGTRSLGRELRARSGGGRLLRAVPETRVVAARITGTTDVVRVPKRPRVSVEFFVPSDGQLRPGDSDADVMARVLSEIRSGAPREIPGRKRTATKYRAKYP